MNLSQQKTDRKKAQLETEVKIYFGALKTLLDDGHIHNACVYAQMLTDSLEFLRDCK